MTATSFGRTAAFRWKTPRAQAANGQHGQEGKILEVHQELPGRTHLVLIRQRADF